MGGRSEVEGAGVQIGGGAETLRPDAHFDTIACRPLADDLGSRVAALSGGSYCRLAGEGAAARLRAALAGVDGVMTARTLWVGDDARIHASPMRNLAHEADAAVLKVADNALAGPWLCRPLQMGFDVVIEDLREWLGIPGRALVARSEKSLARLSELVGDATEEWVGAADVSAAEVNPLVTERLRTVSMRMQRCCDTALAVAHYLAAHPRVAWVSYPGLPEDASAEAAHRALEHGFGARLTFGLADESSVPGALERARLQRCLSTSVSLRDVSSSLLCPATTQPPVAGIPQEPLAGALAFRAGLESPLDVVQALEACL